MLELGDSSTTVDANVDGIPLSTHLAVVDMLTTIVRPALGGG